MKTPLSDEALTLFPEYMAEVRARMETGKQTYGDSSFERPLVTVARELQQEALDFAGWGFIMFARAKRLEELAMEATGPHRVNGTSAGLLPCPAPLEHTMLIEAPGATYRGRV